MLIYDIEAFMRMQMEEDPYDKNTFHYGKLDLIHLMKFLFDVELPKWWLSTETKHIEGYERIAQQIRRHNGKVTN